MAERNQAGVADQKVDADDFRGVLNRILTDIPPRLTEKSSSLSPHSCPSPEAPSSARRESLSTVSPEVS